MADMTLMLAWNQEEAGRIIEVYKMFEHKPPDLIMEKQDKNPHSMVSYHRCCSYLHCPAEHSRVDLTEFTHILGIPQKEAREIGKMLILLYTFSAHRCSDNSALSEQNRCYDTVKHIWFTGEGYKCK